MSLGTMLALSAMATAFLAPLGSLIFAAQQLQLVGAYLARITDVLEAEPEQDRRRVEKAPRLSGRLELRNVGFRYDVQGPWALRGVSLEIEAGQKVALVGSTGSGKSTLAKLLLALYAPTEGDILYDGLPLRSLDYRTLRGQFGVVMQESSLFSGSIRDNIAFNDPNLAFDAVSEAARLASIHEDIVRMPMGYETHVAEDGSTLSGGQRQRLSLARALAHRPVLLVLDEATSHLDVRTERLVDKNLSNLSCTRIVIAHRLSTVRDADVILVLDAGRVVESGAHADLLASGGHYASVIRGQLDPTEADASLTPPKTGSEHPTGYGAGGALPTYLGGLTPNGKGRR